MKMQLWKILIFSAVDDQTIGREMKFIHKALDSGIEIDEKIGIVRVKFLQGGNRSLGYKQYMKCIRWFWMIKRHQGFCFSQSLYGDGKTHILKYPTNQALDPRNP